MFKKIVDEKEFLELCNHELRRHPDFEEGMEIDHVPCDSFDSSLNGYRWDGPESVAKIIEDVVHKVETQYDCHIRPSKNK